MTGHFERGVWIEDKPVPKFNAETHTRDIGAMQITVHVDAHELQELKETLESIHALIVPPLTFWGRLRWLLFGGIVP